MKKLLLITLLALFGSIASAQSRATTVDEYNYLVGGNYSFMLPGYRLLKSNVDIKKDFGDVSREVEIDEFYRPGASQPCAMAIQYKNGLWGTKYLCVPDINSSQAMWAAYDAKLQAINDNMGSNGLQLIAYAMSVYAAGH